MTSLLYVSEDESLYEMYISTSSFSKESPNCTSNSYGLLQLILFNSIEHTW